MSDKIALPVDPAEEIRCACAAPATYENSDGLWGSVRAVTNNGRFCIDCEAFFCRACRDKNAAADENADDELCSACNKVWLDAGFGAATAYRMCPTGKAR